MADLENKSAAAPVKEAEAKAEAREVKKPAAFTYVGVNYKTGVHVHGVGFIKDPKSMSPAEIEKLIKAHPRLEGMIWKRSK